MSRPRVSLRHGILFAVVSALTTWLTLVTWSGFADNYVTYLQPLLLLSLTLMLLGAGLRWLRWPVLAIPLAQLVVTCLVLVAMYGNGEGAGHLPTPAAVSDTIGAFRDAVLSARSYAAPIPSAAPSVAPLLLACGAAAIIAVDLLAASFGRVPLSGLVLLTVYTLPVTVWGRSISWLVFVLVAAGFMSMLFLREDERFSQWGRQITGDPSASGPTGFGVRTGSARGNALAVGGSATVAALVLPFLIPTLDLQLFGGGNGPGPGNSVTIINPMTDLRRDLRQGPDIALLTVRTPVDPSYLRYAVLTSFNGSDWSTGNRSIPEEQSADGQPLPTPLGVDSDVRETTYEASYRSTEAFNSSWLPVPFPAAAVDAPGSWKYDLSTMDFVSPDKVNDLTYSATGIRLEPTREQLDSTRTAPDEITETFTKLPVVVPRIVGDLAEEVTAGRATDFERAVMLQDWFRGPGDFTYSLDAPAGNGLDDLESFLTNGPDGRTGYCEQFASAMAVMARTLGIPARVAVGFLRPDEVGPDTYEFSTRDLHAWPELYLQGAGWVRFEPTPGGVSGNAPAYTQGDLPPVAPSESASASASDSSAPGDGSSVTARERPEPRTDAGSTGGDGGFPLLEVMLGLLGLLLLGVLVMLPRTVRRLRREARWRTGTAEAAWAELRDAATDLAIPWSIGRSPRATGSKLADHFAAPSDLARPPRGHDTNPEAREALARLVGAVEVERYAPRSLEVAPGELRDDVTTCVVALRNGVGERGRRRAEWLPRSWWKRAQDGPGVTSGDIESAGSTERVTESAGR